MKTVVITGAGRGIGLATARFFHDRGWQVAATMRDTQATHGLIEDDRLAIIGLDVCQPVAIEQAIQNILGRFGRVDAWINNAGIGGYGPTEAASDEQMRRIFDVNVFGLANGIKAILPHMKARREGVIVNLSSVTGSPRFQCNK